MKIFIREATVRDAEVIAEFNALMALETEQKVLETGLSRRGVESLLQDPTKGIYLLAEADGRVVGQLMITYEWSDWRNGTFWWIQSVYVEKEFRKQGVFTSLFEDFLKLAKSHGNVCGVRLYVEENNERAKQAYRSLGMTKTHYEMFELDFTE